MRAYSWTAMTPTRETVTAFADSVADAKAFLRKQYHGKDLDKLLFTRPPRTSPMPKGIVLLSPSHHVWLPRRRQ